MHVFCRLCPVVLLVGLPFGIAASPEPTDRLIDERRASERDARWQRAPTQMPAQPQPALHSAISNAPAPKASRCFFIPPIVDTPRGHPQKGGSIGTQRGAMK